VRKILRRHTLALLAWGLIGFASQSMAASAKEYDVDVILPLTGSAAFLGKEEQETLKLAETAINRAGGVQKQPLHFVFYDDQSTPQTSIQLMNRVTMADPPPAVVLGSSLVSNCNAMAPLVQNGPVLYCLSPGIHPPAGSYAFTSSVSTQDIASALIRYFRLKGWTRIAIMTSADATGQDIERGLSQILARPENKDIVVVAHPHFNITDVSVAAQIERIKEAKPQALIAWSTGSPIAVVFKGIIQAGLDIPIATTNGNMTFAQMKQYAAFLPRQLYMPSSLWMPHEGVIKLDPAVEAAQKVFYDAFKAANIKPDIGAALAWDPAMIVAAALNHLGPSPSALEMRNFIANLRGFAGVNGIYDFAKAPQRGLGPTGAGVTLWNPALQAFQLVSKPTGTPLEQ
jgi:branched-chain amino acid transport system substrate-binding protein